MCIRDRYNACYHGAPQQRERRKGQRRQLSAPGAQVRLVQPQLRRFGRGYGTHQRRIQKWCAGADAAQAGGAGPAGAPHRDRWGISPQARQKKEEKGPWAAADTAAHGPFYEMDAVQGKQCAIRESAAGRFTGLQRAPRPDIPAPRSACPDGTQGRWQHPAVPIGRTEARRPSPFRHRTKRTAGFRPGGGP